MSLKKRHTSGSKKLLKEKVVQSYEILLKGDDPAEANPSFWTEFFLLKPKADYLEQELTQLTCDQISTKPQVAPELFRRCVSNLSSDNQVSVVYSLQTLCALLRAAFNRTCPAQHDQTCTITGFLFGQTSVPVVMETLLEQCCDILTGDSITGSKVFSLKLLLLLATGTDNVNSNPLMEVLMVHPVFDALIQVLSSSFWRNILGEQVVALFSFLLSFKSANSRVENPYIIQFSLLDDELALTSFGQVITNCLWRSNQHYMASKSTETHSSWFSSLTSMVGSMFLSEDTLSGSESRRLFAQDAMILALYKAVHLSRTFTSVLSHAESSLSTVPGKTGAEFLPKEEETQLSPEGSEALPKTPTVTGEEIVPANLLVIFLEYCSIVMQSTRGEVVPVSNNSSTNPRHSSVEPTQPHTKICLLTLTVICEDDYALSLMHDAGLVFPVTIHKAVMRHRKVVAEKKVTPRPLVCGLLDLIIEFLVSHLLKSFPYELYRLALGILLRILCHQKRCRMRVASCPWRELWAGLIALCKFLANAEGAVSKRKEMLKIALLAVNLMNVFITYGDTFLPSPDAYDDLYYEIVRCHAVFDNLYALALRHSTEEGELRDSALRLSSALGNVRSIVQHFRPKIEAWLSKQALSTPTQDQILELIRTNYGSLTLKLQDGLDNYERYNESPYDAFLTYVVRNIASDTRVTLDIAALDLRQVLQEVSQKAI